MRCARWVLPLALVLGMAGSAGAATPQERREAAVLTNKARVAARAKRFDEAADALRQADQLDPTPQRKIELAKALVELGKLVEASGLLNGIVNDASLARSGRWHQNSAKKLLAQVEPRIPWLSVRVVGPASGAHVEVDGSEVQAEMESPVDPGRHAIGADADGYESGDMQVTVKEGEHKQVTITLEKIVREPVKPPPSSGTKVPAIAAFSVGAVGLGVGAVFGILAFDETGKAKQYCDGNKCPARPEVVSARNTAIANGNVSTVGFVVGGVGLAAGVILLLTVGSSSKPDEPKKDALTWAPYLNAGETGGEAGLVGRF